MQMNPTIAGAYFGIRTVCLQICYLIDRQHGIFINTVHNHEFLDRQRLLLELDFRYLSDVTDNFFLQSLAEKILLCIHYYCL